MDTIKSKFNSFNEEMEHIKDLRSNMKITVHEELDRILEAHERWGNGNGKSHKCESCLDG
jgi:hypothetical protein